MGFYNTLLVFMWIHSSSHLVSEYWGLLASVDLCSSTIERFSLFSSSCNFLHLNGLPVPFANDSLDSMAFPSPYLSAGMLLSRSWAFSFSSACLHQGHSFASQVCLTAWIHKVLTVVYFPPVSSLGAQQLCRSLKQLQGFLGYVFDWGFFRRLLESNALVGRSQMVLSFHVWWQRLLDEPL